MGQTRDSFVFKRYLFDAIKNLDAEQYKEIMTIITDYSFYSIEPKNLSGIIYSIFILYKKELDKEKKRYDREQGRQSKEYHKWRKAVLQKDDFTCQSCHEKKGILHAHHIKAYADYPELRFVISNGMTLCEKCHRRIHHEK